MGLGSPRLEAATRQPPAAKQPKTTESVVLKLSLLQGQIDLLKKFMLFAPKLQQPMDSLEVYGDRCKTEDRVVEPMIVCRIVADTATLSTPTKVLTNDGILER